MESSLKLKKKMEFLSKWMNQKRNKWKMLLKRYKNEWVKTVKLQKKNLKQNKKRLKVFETQSSLNIKVKLDNNRKNNNIMKMVTFNFIYYYF
jgi:hypothetical protein